MTFCMVASSASEHHVMSNGTRDNSTHRHDESSVLVALRTRSNREALPSIPPALQE